MELDVWILSQNKEIMMKVNFLTIINFTNLKASFENSKFSFLSEIEQVKDFIDSEGWGIVGGENANEHTRLGVYPTKERSIEIMKDIQTWIDDACMRFDGHLRHVYQMPEK